MKHKKQALISIMLTAVFLILSSSPVLAADVQAAYAKMPDDLLAEFDKIGNSEAINVFAWIEDESTAEYEAITANIPEPEFAQNNVPSTYSLQSVASTELTEEERMAQIEEMQNYIMQKRQIAQAVYLEDNTAKAAEIAETLSGGEIVYISKYSPLIIYNVTKSQAVELAMSDCVLGLDRGNVEGEDCLADAKNTIESTAVENNGYLGQGVKIGMIESGVPNKSLDCFSGLEQKITVVGEANEHASCVAAIMIANNIGLARGFSALYAYGTNDNTDMIINIESLLSNGVNVINFSWGFGQDSDYNVYTRWIEHIAYQHNVHCIIASGNYGDDHVADIGMAYNVITVGGVNQYYNLIWISDTSRSAYYTGTVYSNKPDICAPGQNISIELETGETLYKNGTSYAAPLVSGSIAMLCSLNPSLLNKPALVKSILCASVHKNSSRNFATADSDYKKYGAGILSVNNARIVAAMGNYANSTINSNQMLEYDIGYLAAGKEITIALSYLVGTQLTSHENIQFIMTENLSNLDVYLMETSATSTTLNVGSSTSTRTNVEKFTCQINKSGNYKIVIHRKSDSINNSVRFGVAWQVHLATMQ